MAIGRAGLGWANSGPGQNRAGPKLARFFRAKILTAQPALKTRSVGPNYIFKAKKNSDGPDQARPYWAGLDQNWPGFVRAKILTAQPTLKTGLVWQNYLFKAKKNSGGPGHTGPGQIWSVFFRANNLMAQPGPNFRRTGLAHQVGSILLPLLKGS